MPPVLFLVKFRVPEAIRAEFDRWYAEEHLPEVTAFPGYLAARRFRTLLGDDGYDEISLFEFRDEAALRAYLDSDHRRKVTETFDRLYGSTTERVRAAYEQIWP